MHWIQHSVVSSELERCHQPPSIRHSRADGKERPTHFKVGDQREGKEVVAEKISANACPGYNGKDLNFVVHSSYVYGRWYEIGFATTECIYTSTSRRFRPFLTNSPLSISVSFVHFEPERLPHEVRRLIPSALHIV